MDTTTTAAITVLVGLAASIITALVKQPGWSTQRKRNVSLLVAGVLGLLSAIITRMIAPPPGADWPWWETAVSWLTWVVCMVAVVITVSQGIYSQLKDPLDKLAAATSTNTGEKYTPERALDEMGHPPAELVPPAEQVTDADVRRLSDWHDEHDPRY